MLEECREKPVKYINKKEGNKKFKNVKRRKKEQTL